MATNRLSRPALFLDRDGVINVDRHYVYRIEDFEFMPGIMAFCRAAVDRGLLLFVITNQSGIGRGLFPAWAFHALTAWMLAQFAKEGLIITQVYHCPHHPDASQQHYRKVCNCRKPEPGMILQAAREHALDLSQSVLIGDKRSDIQAGQRAGVGTLMLLSAVDATEDSDPHGLLHAVTLQEAQARLFPRGTATDA